MSWENINKADGKSIYYRVLKKEQNKNSIELLREIFPDGEANEMNFVLFSTSGVHGTYNTIEDAEEYIKNPSEDGFNEITFLVVQPRIVCLRYGNCNPETEEDFVFLKKLRETSRKAMLEIG